MARALGHYYLELILSNIHLSDTSNRYQISSKELSTGSTRRDWLTDTLKSRRRTWKEIYRRFWTIITLLLSADSLTNLDPTSFEWRFDWTSFLQLLFLHVKRS